MLSLWLFFYLGYTFGCGPDVWWGFPLVITGLICTVIELVCYIHMAVKHID